MQIPNIDFSNVETWQDVRRFASQVIKQVISALNRGLIFSDNFDAKTISAVFDTANAEIKVAHNLGRSTQGYLVQSLSAAAIVYAGTSAADDNSIYLRASAPCTASLLVY